MEDTTTEGSSLQNDEKIPEKDESDPTPAEPGPASLGDGSKPDPAATEQTKPTPSPEPSCSGESIDFKVVFNKKKYDITFGSEETIGALKSHLQDIIGVPSTMQKIMIKGLAKDEMSLKKLGVVKGSKVMVVGSTLNDVLEVAKKPSVQQLKEEEKKEAQKESWSQQKIHKKILEKGVPDDAMPGIKVSLIRKKDFSFIFKLNNAFAFFNTEGYFFLTIRLKLKIGSMALI